MLAKITFAALLAALLSSPAQAQGIVTTVAGNDFIFPDDGKPATQAQLVAPDNVAFDRQGRLIIVDSVLSQILRIESDGTIRVIAGNGLVRFAGDGGAARAASLSSPRAVAFDASDNLYIADGFNIRVRRVAPDGTIRTFAGNGNNQPPLGDGGPATSAALAEPHDIVFDAAGNLYILERAGFRIRKVTPAGIITTIAGNGEYDFAGDGGPAAGAKFRAPDRLAIDTAGNLFVVDTQNQRVRRIGTDGIIRTIAGGGNSPQDGVPATNIQLNNPSGIAIDPSGTIYISDTYHHRVLRLPASGVITTFAGAGTPGFSGDGGSARRAELSLPKGLTLDSAGNLYIADSDNQRVRRVDTAGVITTVAGQGAFLGDGGAAADARLAEPIGITLDSGGNLYISDQRNHRIRKVTPGGVISTLIGQGRAGFSPDGTLAANAFIGSPRGIAADSAGNIFFADADNSRIRVVRANGTLGTVADGGITLNNLQVVSDTNAMTTDAAGNVFYATNLVTRILRRSPNGNLTVVAGTGTLGFSGDGGPATNARIGDVNGIAVDAAGNIYFSEVRQHRVRRVDRNGIITTFAGNGQIGSSGDGGPATQAVVGFPGGLVFDRAGNLYITNGNRIRRVAPDGTITTYAGSGFGFSGDGGSARSASFTGLLGLAIDPVGNLYVTDVQNNRIRLIQSGSSASIILSQRGLTFNAAGGGSAPPSQALSIVNAGQGTMNWSVLTSVTTGARNWLSAAPATGASPAGQAGPPVTISADPSGLAPGDYYGQIEVRSPSAPNSPQLVTVVLRIGNAPPGPVIQPSGLLFIAEQGGQNPAAQSFTITLQSVAAAQFRSTASFGGGRAWFTLTGGDGTVRAGQPATLRIDPNIAGFAPGVYDGNVTVAFTSGQTPILNLTLVVGPPGSASPTAAKGRTADACTPTRLVPVVTSVGAGFRVVTGLPSPIEARIVDDCTRPMTEGTVTAEFSNGDAPLSLTPLRDGRWSATWQARNPGADNVAITLRAQSGTATGTTRVQGGVQANENAPPEIATGGVLHAASFALGGTLAPGSLVSVFGQRLASADASAASLPLPTLLGDTRLSVAGRPLPLVFTSASQVNAIIPFDIAINATHQMVVRRGTTLSVPEPIDVASTQSGVFTKDLSGRGDAIVVVARADGSQGLAGPDNPASSGDVLVIYCTGLGLVEPRGIAGSATPSTPLSRTVEAVTVTIGGVEANVVFAGLTPGFTGLYQINVVVPGGVAPDAAVPLVVTQGGRPSRPVSIAVR